MKTIKLIFALGILLLAFQCKKDDTTSIETKEISDFSSENLSINSIYSDINGNTWLCSKEGLYSYDGNNWTQYTETDLAQNIITVERSFENVNKYFIGTKKGIIVLEGDYGEFSIVDKFNTSNSDLASDSITIMAHGPENKLWIGTEKGLSYFDKGTWKKYVHTNVGNVSISGLAFTSTNYFATTHEDAIFNLKNPEVDGFTGASQMMEGFNGKLTTESIHCALSKTTNQFMFGTSRGLTHHTDPTYTRADSNVFQYHLIGENVLSLLETQSGDIWVGKESGLSVYSGTEWTNYISEGGASSVMFTTRFPNDTSYSERIVVNELRDSLVYSLSEDFDGNIWVATSKGINVYNGSTWSSH